MSPTSTAVSRSSAYVVLKPESKGKVTEKEIIDFCRSKIASYKAPRGVVFVDDLPKTLVGKVLRRKLRDRSDWQKDAATPSQ